MTTNHDLKDVIGPSMKGSLFDIPMPGNFQKAKDRMRHESRRGHFHGKTVRGSIRRIGWIGGLKFQIDLDAIGFDRSVPSLEQVSCGFL